jgi:asparagine synthase (glutamine-hydrolysing)
MCGIAGIVNLTGRAPIDPALIGRMADALHHRGPDEDGYFFRPGLALASRRLSIVGLFDGRQPIHNEDRSVSVVFNGELFDYPEARARLSGQGHVFRTHCDTEIVPHLYEDHAEGMLERLRGQFALALWDERRQRLLLARDRFGICPLHWTRQTVGGEEMLLFASEIKALLASGLVPARPDPRGINHAFTFFAIPGPVTCFQGVQTLLPGRYLSLAVGQGETGPVQERIYWEIDFPDRGQEESGEGQRVVDDFEAVFLGAVERRLRADVPVVSYLSGGVDSSIVVALACHLRGREDKPPIPTFTIAVQDPELNERNEAALVARHLSAEPVVVDCGAREILQTYPDLIRAAEGPVIDTSCAALLMLARKVHEHGYKVALTGEGADEWLAGYPWYKVHRLLGLLDVVPGLSLLARRAYLRLTRSPRFPWSVARRIHEAIGGPNAWLDIYGLFGASKLRFFSRDMWDQLGDHLPYTDLQLNLDRARRWHPLNRSLYLGARVMLPGLLLAAKGDRVAMHSSVETRYPFLDEDVFTFLARLHPRWKLRGLRDKLILRKMAQRWIPKQIAWRRKAMFRAPFDAFHADPKTLPPFVDQLLSHVSLKRTAYFDPAAVAHWRQVYRTMRPGSPQRTMVEMGLVGVVSTQLWHHTYIDGALADLPSLAGDERRSMRVDGIEARDEYRPRLAAHPLPVSGRAG